MSALSVNLRRTVSINKQTTPSLYVMCMLGIDLLKVFFEKDAS